MAPGQSGARSESYIHVMAAPGNAIRLRSVFAEFFGVFRGGGAGSDGFGLADFQQEAHDLQELYASFGFGDEGVGAGLAQLFGERSGIVHAEDNDFGLGRNAADLRSSFEPAHHGHADIENDEVGMEILDLLDAFPAVFGFATDFQAGLAGEQCADTGADQFVIINNQHAEHFTFSSDLQNAKCNLSNSNGQPQFQIPNA